MSYIARPGSVHSRDDEHPGCAEFLAERSAIQRAAKTAQGESMIMTNDPVWLSVTYAECSCECHATLRVSANNDPALTVSIVHNHIRLYDLVGNATLDDLQVRDGDTLLIVVRDKGHKSVASGEFQVQMNLIGRLSVILNPRLATYLIVDQQSQKLIDRAARRALEAVYGESGADTGDLVSLEVR